MKPLHQLMNVEKGRLLFNFFPQEIPSFIHFTYNLCATVIENKDVFESYDNDPLLNPSFRIELAKDICKRIEKYGPKIARRSCLFSDQLFDGYPSLLIIYCLQEYAKQKDQCSAKFSIAIDLLFNP